MQNIQASSPKLSYIDIQLNKMIHYIILIMLIFSAISTGLGVDFKNQNDVKDGVEIAYYIYPNLETTGNVTTNYVVEVFQIFAAFFINYTTFLPLSLMVLIELIKPIQLGFISVDEEMKKEGEEFKAFSMKLQENLGAVKYIFSDKTGTLTKNEMIFHSCSIFGYLYESNESLGELDNNKALESNKSWFNNVNVRSKLINDRTNSNATSLNDNEENIFPTINSAINEFLLGIALNHNILPETDEISKEVVFTGPSPDEVALLFAIKDLGFEFLEKKGEKLIISVNGNRAEYEILFQFDFSSERKRSSIIVKDQMGNIKLFMKGADDIILERINAFSEEHLKFTTKSHLDKFAKYGLRTLCYAMKPLSQEYYDNWVKEYNEMKYKSISNKALNSEVNKLISQVEDNSYLLGVTGLDDKLQDDVNVVINDFLNAGISVWMLTGDKLDTAESIGFSCKLFNDDTEVFKIKVDNKANVKNNVIKILAEMERIETDIMNFKIQKDTYNERAKETFIKQYYQNSELRMPSEEIISKSRIIEEKEKYEKKTEVNNLEDHNEQVIDNNLQFYNTQQPQRMILDSNIITPDKKMTCDSLNKFVNDVKILKFIMEQKKEEGKSNREEDEKEESVSIFNNIINEQEQEIEEEGLEKKQSLKLINVRADDVVFEINDVYNNYQSQIHEINKRRSSFVNKMELVDEKEKKEKELETKSSLLINFGLIIEGEAISHFIDPDLQEYSWKLVQKSRSIICCRCNPLQKSEVVKFIKAKTNDLVLSIGDGGNDVNMIKVSYYFLNFVGSSCWYWNFR